MKSLVSVASLWAAVSAFALTPTVSNVTISQDDARKVHVAYTLAGAPAIVTVDLYTNDVCISKFVSTVTGDGNCLVAANGSHEMVWKVRKDWPDRTTKLANAVRAEVRAHHPSNPPDVIVMNLAENSDPAVNYYASVGSLPGGLLENDDYRISKLVVKKCPVKYRTFMLGAPINSVGRENGWDVERSVTFTNDYYMGVFELTGGQWDSLMGARHNQIFGSAANDRWKVRPLSHVSHADMRETGDRTRFDDAYRYPHSPSADSFFGKLYARTGLRCDLPSAAQWEVACDCGRMYGWYGRHSVTNVDDDIGFRGENGYDYIGRYKYNGGNVRNGDGSYSVPAEDCDFSQGTAKVGSYEPNAWGFYDMFGNLVEKVLDDKQGSNYSNAYDVHGEAFVDGTTSGTDRSIAAKGGAQWNSGVGHGAATCGWGGPKGDNQHAGCRVMYRVNQAGYYSDL